MISWLISDCVHKAVEYVCGGDGENYSNICELKKKSCLKQTNISVAYLGLCIEGNQYLKSKVKLCLN